MRTIIQRVTSASVTINNDIMRDIGKGLVVLCAFTESDTPQDIAYVADKIAGLRIFSDSSDKLNLSVKDIGGEVLIVSNFTLYGDTTHGKRPSFSRSAKGDISLPLYDMFVAQMKGQNVPVATGEFGADMQLELINDGPVTVMVESK